MEYAGIDIAKPDGADARIAPPEISRPTGAGASAGEPPLTSSVKWTMRFPANPRRQFRGVSLRATDCEFQVGHGNRVDGPIKNIVLAGRNAGLTGLCGAVDAIRFGA
jgi:hypothetical protein